MQRTVDLRDIIFPSRCLGCRILHKGLCPRCKLLWKFTNIESSVEGVPVFSSLRYNSVASHILLSAKEDGIKEGDDFLVAALRCSLGNFPKGVLLESVLVPVPSTSRSNRRRGRAFMFDLTKKISEIEFLPVWDALEHGRKIADQGQLDAKDRQRNLAGAMRIRGCRKPGRSVILLDDLLTSGATLSEAVKTMNGSGASVSGAITAFLAHPIR